MLAFIYRHPVAFGLAILLHILILLGLTYQNFMTPDDVIKVTLTSPDEEAVDHKTVDKMKPMKTTLLDAKTVQAALDKVKQQEAEKKRQQQALVAKTEAEKRRLAQIQQQENAERKKAEQARLLAEAKQREAEQAAKQAAIQQQKVAAEQKRAQAEKKKAEKAKQEALLAEKQRQQAAKQVAEAEAQRKVEEDKKKVLQEQIKQHSAEKKRLEQEALKARLLKEQEEEEAQIQQQIAAEEAKKRQMAKQKQEQNLRDVYKSSIASAVKQNWRTAARISDKAECMISITQTPNGMVSSVKVDHCNSFANAQFKKDAESAVLRSQPLPQPPMKELFERNIQFKFKP